MEYNVNIRDMRLGDEVEGFYILSGAVRRQTAQGKPYLTGTVSDRSGGLDFVIWDYTGALGPEDNGSVIKLRGRVSEFKGSLQLAVQRIRPAEESDPCETERLVPTAPIDREAELRYVEELAASIADDDYRRMAQRVLGLRRESFARIPAAKSVHHGFVGGLLMHTANMMRTADFLTGLYADAVDRDLLLCGTLLHDMAKAEEFVFSPLGLAVDYSVEGELLGHLVMGAQQTARLAEELALPREKSLLLQHLILSHHGEPEFGAAVRPLCAEAELLHLIDLIDSRMEIYAETLEGMAPGSFSGRIFALDRKIYRPLGEDPAPM